MNVEPVAHGLPEIPDLHFDVWPAKISAAFAGYDPYKIGFFTIILCILLLLLYRNMPFVWVWAKHNNSNRKEEREMRRERADIQQRTFADSLEERIAFLIDEGDMTTEEAKYWRSFFAQKLPDLRKPKDVRVGIIARFMSGWYAKPAPLPDAVQPVTSTTSDRSFGH